MTLVALLPLPLACSSSGGAASVQDAGTGAMASNGAAVNAPPGCDPSADGLAGTPGASAPTPHDPTGIRERACA